MQNAPNYTLARLYDFKLFDLIPLHKPFAKSKDKRGREREDGKRPLHNNWTKRPVKSAATLEWCEEHGHNIGVKLRATQVVIDVDPRNGGVEGFAQFCADTRFDPSKYPHVITGSGGSHYMTTKAADIPVLDTIDGYPGVEFKSSGRQVVAMGSLHPKTGEEYKLAPDSPDINTQVPLPKNVLDLITRPVSNDFAGAEGTYTQEEVAEILAQIDPTKFRDYSEWIAFMASVHFASAGDARQEFVDWSTSDPNYADASEEIGRKWDSFHRKEGEGPRATTGSFEYHMRQHGVGEKQKARTKEAQDDFAFEGDYEDGDVGEDAPRAANDSGDFDFEGEDIEDGDGVPPGDGLDDEAVSRLEELNSKYWAVMEQGKFRIVYQELDTSLKVPRHFWIRATRKDFEDRFCNTRLERDTTGMTRGTANTIPLGRAWIEWPRRRTVDRILFDPTGAKHEGCLNLWTGFGVAPSPKGSYKLLDELLFEAVCNGEQASYDYIKNWIRFLFQFPGEMPEVAVVMKGEQGTGKGTVGKIIAHMVGRHALPIASADKLTGRFNAHLQDIIFLFADEAIRPYDKEAESRLKNILTEHSIAYEGKGRDAVVGPNYLHVMMASNEHWVIPAGSDDGHVRRFFVTEVNRKWQHQDAKFQAIWDEMRAGGFGRLLFDSLNTPLPVGWHPRKFPNTKALFMQKMHSQSPVQQFLFDLAYNGTPPFSYSRGPWESHPVRVFRDTLKDHFVSWCRQSGIHSGNNGRANPALFEAELEKMHKSAKMKLWMKTGDDDTVHTRRADGRAQAIELPSLPEMREDFERLLGGKPDWPALPDGKTDDDDDFAE